MKKLLALSAFWVVFWICVLFFARQDGHRFNEWVGTMVGATALLSLAALLSMLVAIFVGFVWSNFRGGDNVTMYKTAFIVQLILCIYLSYRGLVHIFDPTRHNDCAEANLSMLEFCCKQNDTVINAYEFSVKTIQERTDNPSVCMKAFSYDRIDTIIDSVRYQHLMHFAYSVGASKYQFQFSCACNDTSCIEYCFSY